MTEELTEEYVIERKKNLNHINKYKDTFSGSSGEYVIKDLINRYLLGPEKINPDEANVVKYILANISFDADALLTHIERIIENG